LENRHNSEDEDEEN